MITMGPGAATMTNMQRTILHVPSCKWNHRHSIFAFQGILALSSLQQDPVDVVSVEGTTERF